MAAEAGTAEPVYVVIGGGIAGVSCAEELSRSDPKSSIHLVSGTPLIKAVTNFTQVSRSLEQFDVQERSGTYLAQLCPNVTVWTSLVESLDPSSHSLQLVNGKELKYDKLCICTGGRPKTIARNHPRVIGIRDTESVQEFQKRLGESRRIVVVGNGGIATELVYEVRGCEVVWAIKDNSITRTFFDEGAATFFLPHLANQPSSRQQTAESATCSSDDVIVEVSPLRRTKYAVESRSGTGNRSSTNSTCEMGMGPGGALGPDWHSELKMTGKAFDEKYRHIHVEYQCEIAKLLSPEEFKASRLTASTFPLHHESIVNKSSTHSEDHTHRHTQTTPSPSPAEASDWPVYVELTNGTTYGCDLVVSATGVVPNSDVMKIKKERGVGELKVSSEKGGGGILVDSQMRSSLRDVYAAGDVCTVQWKDQAALWFQMRLWTQARQMGAYAARCMVAHSRGEDMSLDFCFELFAHVTQFFGFKVVLLGRYNGQGLGNDYEILLRCTKGQEYIKVILQNGRMVGAILIGETDLEETFENLILNQMDLSRFGESLLDPSVDLEDYFD